MFHARPSFAVLACLSLVLAAPTCTRVPDLDERRGDTLRRASYPELIPLEPALAADAAEPDSAEALQREMEWRRDQLRARAARLRAARAE